MGGTLRTSPNELANYDKCYQIKDYIMALEY